MSGHSKWSKVKHQKEQTDSVKAKIFTKMTNAIIIAVRQGGGVTDPIANVRLRLAIDRARLANMPKDKIERALQRGKGEGAEGEVEEAIYEAFGPGGVGIIIEAVTNNKQRTVAGIKNVLDHEGGNLAQSGSVAHMFELVGLIRVLEQGKTSDEIMEAAIDGGAIDIDTEGEENDIYTQASKLHEVKETISARGISISSSELYYRPKIVVPVTNKETASKLLRLLTNLEELEDVHTVFANFDIPNEFL
ncbi:YebC/PmpR family DNA-binding transcriptional regulator [Candidatus Gottesmanbacteria bacterium]|nr:YebC/PmpR family DNA-binding transcriptional regulator [Candidatus Gottesmanbacteria bacterium]